MQCDLISGTRRILVLLLACLSVGVVSAGEWRETFDDGNLAGWTLMFQGIRDDWDVTWEVEDGILNVRLEALLDWLEREDIASFLEWTAQPVQTSHLNVRMRSPVSLDVKLGVFLGKRLPEENPNYAEGYLICHHSVDEMAIGREASWHEGGTLASFFAHDWYLEYRAGHFTLLSEELFPETWLLLEFEDVTLPQVDVMGILAISPWIVPEGHGAIDTLSFEGPNMPNHPSHAVEGRELLTVAWGQLKCQTCGRR